MKLVNSIKFIMYPFFSQLHKKLGNLSLLIAVYNIAVITIIFTTLIVFAIYSDALSKTFDKHPVITSLAVGLPIIFYWLLGALTTILASFLGITSLFQSKQNKYIAILATAINLFLLYQFIQFSPQISPG